ncbi:TetR/AcrR family transcriptional regulator [uncultured Clostridium sp.]|jgi:AcrR family transcriptional regulator|uniref:TetR/AcrR family transcriptional regulator n=1 Tax=uncultured Clostridium sp. TaxID=59620 RepID=UPI00260DFCD3|nr:TetR/AcrR family transcriptional regulator [uncultured Clostridium sp.]
MDNTYEKRNDILHAAVYLFSNKGFTATSVQDIASHCNISKATIYKLFKSKEDLLIQIFKYLNKQIFLLVENIDLEGCMSDIEKFEEKLYVFFEHLSSKKEFTLMIYQDQTILRAEEFKKILIDSKFCILNWFKAILLDTYGKEIEPIIWDITLSLAGLVKEFSQIFVTREFLIKDLREVSKYIVRDISAIVKININEEPLIPSEVICGMNFNTDSFFNKDLLLEEASLLIDSLKSIIKNSKAIINKEEINEAIDTLVLEQNSKTSRRYIIDGLFLYLLKYSELEKDVLFLKQIYRKL